MLVVHCIQKQETENWPSFHFVLIVWTVPSFNLFIVDIAIAWFYPSALYLLLAYKIDAKGGDREYVIPMITRTTGCLPGTDEKY